MVAPASSVTAAPDRYGRIRWVPLPGRLLVPWEVGTLVFLGALLTSGLAGWLAPRAIGLVLAAGGTGLLLVMVLGRWLLEHGATSNLPETGPSRSFESAFVCSQCAEYTPPPDWGSLLKDAGSTAEIGLVGPMPAARTAVHRTVVGSWESHVTADGISVPSGRLLSGPETSFVAPERRTVPLIPGDGPELMLAEGRLVPSRIGPSAFSISGARRTAPKAVATSPLPRADPTDSMPARPSEVGREPPTLEQWIATEVNGIVSRAPSASFDSAAPEALLEDLELLAAIAWANGRPCASCRGPVTESPAQLECPDCRRPMCDPCRARAVEHDGASWCAPCAVNRLSTEFLGVLESADRSTLTSRDLVGPP